MDVVSNSALPVASMVWQRRPGVWAFTVICKATFHLQPGTLELADAQDPPAPDDVVPFKARADVVVVGSVYAPGGQPARSVRARIAFAEIDKTVEVHCDRIFWQDGRVLEGQPFAVMPLVYERAAGGPGTWNPVGMRFDGPPDHHGAIRIPNVQPPGAQVARRGDTFPPVGLGPIAAGWPGRADPADPAYHNAAPRDQRVEAIRPGERIALENLHPEIPRLVTRLPDLAPRAFITSGGMAGEEIALVADTLRIDTDRALVSLVWRGSVALGRPDDPGRVSVSLDGGGGETMALPQALETVAGAAPRGPALPFAAGKSPWAGFQARPREAIAQVPSAATGTLSGVMAQGREVLPFAPEKPRATEPEEPERIGPLAKMEVEPAKDAEANEAEAKAAPASEAQASEAKVDAAPAAPVEEAKAAAPAAKALVEVDLPLADFPIDRCAAIAASIARRGAEMAAILEAVALRPEVWVGLDRHYSDAILAETMRGKRALLASYDAAYVGRLEEERGPIAVEEYADLVVAAERGQTDKALADLGLPRGAMARIERVWLKKVMGDPALGKRINRAVKAAREA